MTTILFLMGTFSLNQLKYSYLKTKNLFVNFSRLWKSISTFKHFEKMMTCIAYVFPILRTVKDMVS